jgi:tetratricopeptide (TPR) repeat protein
MMQFPYASATTTMTVIYVRVIKPDKTVVTTPTENVLDMPAQITQQAPLYSDLKVLQVAVKGLEVGDTLEFQWRADTTKPLDPGQFWNSFNFMRRAIVLHEQLQVSIPSDRKVLVKSAKVQPAITTEGANRVYTWNRNNLKVDTDKQSEAGDSKLPDVQLTSLQNWDELGKWFGGLAGPRAVPTPEIKAKADELTRGATTQQEKIQDLYAFVSTHFRYIGIDLGIGRYQPHSAADVLSNDYGDCKDKHTLLAALLAAEGVKAYPALINSAAKIDRDVPSPLQFDHVITAIPQGKGYLFLDTTPEVGPFGFLVNTLRDKWALVIPDHGPAQLVKTPADPPYPLRESFQADATLDATGTLTGKMQLTLRDDSELVFRLIFRQAGQSQWTTVMQKVSQNLGFGGTVSDVTATPPDDTTQPFHIQYSYVRKDYSDWDDKQITPPFPPIFIPAAPDDSEKNPKPVKLGSPEVADYQATIILPGGFNPQVPAAVHLSTPFADYDATYSYALGVLHAERTLTTKEREVQPAEFDAYRKFLKAVQKDGRGYIPLSSPTGSNFPSNGVNPDALSLYNQGRQAMQLRDIPGAADYFQQAVEKDPKFAMGWTALGMAHATMGSRDQAVDDLKKAIALDPTQVVAYEALATLYMMQRRTDEALAVWKQLEQAAPSNVTAPIRVGAILLNLKRYPEALTEMQAAETRNPENAEILLQLGVAYAKTGAPDKAYATFQSALQIDPSSNNLNSIAYEMANSSLKLPEALQYAQKAVGEEEAATAEIDINTATPEDFASASRLAAYWDTLGWAYFRNGDLDEAGKYLNAGWRLSQDPTIADHLGQLYEKEGKNREAAHAYAEAIATGHAPDHSQERVDALGGDRSADYAGAGDLQSLRIVKVALTPKPKDHANADFAVLLSPGGRVDANFVSGSEELRTAGKALAAAKFDFPFPDQGPVKMLRRGILDCEPELKECSFAMYPLSYPQQLEVSGATRPGSGSTILNLKPNDGPTLIRRGDEEGKQGSKPPQ